MRLLGGWKLEARDLNRLPARQGSLELLLTDYLSPITTYNLPLTIYLSPLTLTQRYAPYTLHSDLILPLHNGQAHHNDNIQQLLLHRDNTEG